MLLGNLISELDNAKIQIYIDEFHKQKVIIWFAAEQDNLSTML